MTTQLTIPGLTIQLTIPGLTIQASSADSNDWYTPEPIIVAARTAMGQIDLDPASCARANSVVEANWFFTQKDNGLLQEWRGRVFLNPPYSSDLLPFFVEKLLEEWASGRTKQAVVLVNNSTETRWFRDLLADCSSLCLLCGRLRFWGPRDEGGTPRQGQAVFYFGPERERFREVFRRLGTILEVL